MSHSNAAKPLCALRIIAPIGAYLGRVQKGIDHALTIHGNRNADIQLTLVVSEEYLSADPQYEADFVKKGLDWIEQTWKSTFPQITAGTKSLQVTDKDKCMCWLVEQLVSFFKKYPRNSRACIDLTSAPREWFFVSMDICSMFGNVEFYHVASAKRSVPSDFPQEEKTEPGTLVENVKTGVLVEPLSYWLRPKDEEGYPTEHHILFQTLWEHAGNKGKTFRFDDIANLFKARCLEAYDEALKGKSGQKKGRRRDVSEELGKRKRRLEGMAPENVKKKITRYLTDISSYRLFKDILGKYEFTDVGATMARILFEASGSTVTGMKQ